MKQRTLALLLSLILFTACASNKRVEQVEGTLANQRQQQQQLQQQWRNFAAAYTPDMRQELQRNLDASKQHQQTISRLRQRAESGHQHLQQSLQQSEHDLATIRRNREDSQVLNVVNEFRRLEANFEQLQNQWEHNRAQLQRLSHRNQTQLQAADVQIEEMQRLSHRAHRYEQRIQQLEHEEKELDQHIRSLAQQIAALRKHLQQEASQQE